MTKRRLFIAINLPENVKERLIGFQAKWTDLEPHSVNWVIKPNLHITLVFLGYVNDDEMYEICQTMKQVAKQQEPFSLKLERIIVGPPNATPRMFWAEGEKSQKLADLQGDLNNVIQQRTGYQYKAFRPHITLARFKYEVAKKIREMPKVEELLNITILVESIELMQSNLKRTGPVYAVLESIELGR